MTQSFQHTPLILWRCLAWLNAKLLFQLVLQGGEVPPLLVEHGNDAERGGGRGDDSVQKREVLPLPLKKNSMCMYVSSTDGSSLTTIFFVVGR